MDRFSMDSKGELDHYFSNVSANHSFEVAEKQLIFNVHQIHRALITGYFVLAALTCILGSICNMTCFLAVLIYPSLMRHRGNILVGQLVLFNFLLTAAVYPISMISLLLRGLPWVHLPSDFCNWAVFYYLCVHCLVWHECLLALNRFVAVLFPTQYSHISSRRSIYTTIALGYVVPLSLNLYASATKIPTFSSNLPFGGCLYNRLGDRTFQLIHGVLGVYLPMGVVGAAYLIIFTQVFLAKLLSKEKLSSLQLRRIAVAQMLFAAFLWFCLTYLPHPIINSFFRSVYDKYPLSYFVARWAMAAGASLNSVVYALTNREFRKGMLYILRFRKRRINTTRANVPHEAGNLTGLPPAMTEPPPKQ